MSIVSTSVAWEIATFVTQAKVVLGAGAVSESSLRQVGDLMRRLTERDDLYPSVDHRDLTDDLPPVDLHVEADGSCRLSLVRISTGEPTRVHAHRRWGVACVYKGVDLCVKWRRVGDCSRINYAVVLPVDRQLLARGEPLCWLDSPRDLHSQWGQGGHAVWELVLTGPGGPGTSPHA